MASLLHTDAASLAPEASSRPPSGHRRVLRAQQAPAPARIQAASMVVLLRVIACVWLVTLGPSQGQKQPVDLARDVLPITSRLAWVCQGLAQAVQATQSARRALHLLQIVYACQPLKAQSLVQALRLAAARSAPPTPSKAIMAQKRALPVLPTLSLQHSPTRRRTVCASRATRGSSTML